MFQADIEKIYKIFLESEGISTDTRQLKAKQLFWALKGENFDGNEFVEQALANGAVCAVTENKKYIGNSQFFYTPNSLQLLQKLAAFHRKKLNLPIIAITGTNGKTTTKELTHRVLLQKYKVKATYGNLNNHIGVPLTLLRFSTDTEIGIVEMGANHPGEIQELCEIAKPDFGIITNVGKAHLDGFGNFETLLNTKTALYRTLKKKGCIFLPINNRILTNASGKQNVITYGTNPRANVPGKLLQSFPSVSFSFQNSDNQTFTINSKLPGSYNFENLLAATCIGLHFKVPPKDIKNALEAYTPSNNRSQVVDYPHGKIILDAYNANPTSMQKALESFFEIPAKTKIVFCGDMFELGKYAEEEHKNILNKLLQQNQENKYKSVFLSGKNFRQASQSFELPNNFHVFETTAEVLSHIQPEELQADYLLIKGSRGMQMEQIARKLTQKQDL
ncbi:MAG: hypothetical protein CSB06_01510 [Bacteroidia bacterium]|nr:MAG: hypothetical protein CSB06_01510 [Bacteroidia bacterium]